MRISYISILIILKYENTLIPWFYTSQIRIVTTPHYLNYSKGTVGEKLNLFIRDRTPLHHASSKSSLSHYCNVTGTSERPTMVGHRVDVTKVWDPAGIWTHAGYRRGLAAFARRSVLGMVADRDSAIGSAATGGHPGHYQPGKAIASHREDSRSHGAKTADRCSRTVWTDDDIIEHLQRWPGDHGDSNVGRSAIVEDNEASTVSGASPIVVLWPGEPRILYVTFHGETSKPIKGHNYVAQGFLAKAD